MNGPRFEVFEDAAGEHRFRLVAANGEIVMASEGYTREADARRGVMTARALVLQEAAAQEAGAAEHYIDG